LSAAAEILPEKEYWPGAIDEYNPPFPRAPYAVPVVDSTPVLAQAGFGIVGGGVQLVELIAVTFVSLAKKFTDGALTPKL
jgi:hypothetical protein